MPCVFTSSPTIHARMADFFAAHIRNVHTRRAYMEAVRQFSVFCAERGIVDLIQVQPIHVAAFVEQQLEHCSKPTIKLRLAALRALFDWLVVGQVLPANPAHAVRGPKYVQRRAKTPVLLPDEARLLLNSIDTSSVMGQRDRALIGVMVSTFARVGAALSMRVQDVFVQGRRVWVRLHEKGGKEHQVPAHENLACLLKEYIEAAHLATDRKAPLFRTVRGRSGELTSKSMLQSDVWRMIRRRTTAAGIETDVCCHTCRATDITTFLTLGGKLEVAQQMAAHESIRTTTLYDLRTNEVSFEDVMRVGI